jgi:hypothetical protein
MGLAALIVSPFDVWGADVDDIYDFDIEVDVGSSGKAHRWTDTR